MQFYQEADIINFFDVSIIMSFYKKMKDFRRVLPKNQPYFQRNGVEVILVMDEMSEEQELLDFISLYPQINWRVIINRTPHEWRNHCKVLNVGIRHAKNNFILVLDPEVELYTDIIYQMRYMLSHYPGSFAVGKVIFADHNTTISHSNLQQFRHMPYGCIMADVDALSRIGGYAEHYTMWGGEDDNVRTRLELAGYYKLTIPEAITVHREDNSDEHNRRTEKSSRIPPATIRETFFPKTVHPNMDDWGSDFNDVIFDWQHNTHPHHRSKFLKTFERYELNSEQNPDEHFPIICLIQTRNEQRHIPFVLQHLDKHCDGIILLDDGSEDLSYESAQSDKLILKVKKRYKGYFDDLENRNVLLSLANLFNSDWLFFMDADERFDERYSDLRAIASMTDIDVARFQLVHLWNNDQNYRIDVPRSFEGKLYRYRMFRNKGFTQISANRELHFAAVPYKNKSISTGVLIRHYGLMDVETRERKYRQYLLQDPEGKKQGHDYEYLIDEKVHLASVEELMPH